MWTEHCTQPGQSSEYYRYCFLCGCLLRLEKILLTSPVLNPYKEKWQGQAPSLLQIQVRFQEYRPFITGKSQGGVLSPTLFKISINDKYPLPDGCKIIFYKVRLSVRTALTGKRIETICFCRPDHHSNYSQGEPRTGPN